MKLPGWLRGRGPWLVILLLLAASYFGSYVRSGINFRDEGGTEGLVAQRLLAGERPLVDVVLGYNVLWFYPIVALFKFAGVNFVLLRGYCFFLSTITAVTGFLAVERATGRRWLAFLVGVMLVLVPGMTFKNYMPLLAVTNSACLLHYALAERERRWRWITAGGGLLGLTFLIRIDVGLFVLGLWVGAIFLRAVARGTPARQALGHFAGGVALVLALVAALHLPVCLDARQRGFAEPFLQQYLNWPHSFVLQLQQRFTGAPRKTAQAATPALPAPAAATLRSNAAAPVPSQHTLARKGLGDLLSARNGDEQMLIVLLYLPLLSLGLLTAWAAGALVRAWWRGEAEPYHAALGALVMIGASLTTFPQYFFFRPDSPHLSEFSPGFWVGVVGSLLLLAGRGWKPARRWMVAALALLLTAHAALFLYRMLPDRWTGSIWARKNRTHEFRGENGVNVLVTRRELEGLTSLQRLIQTYSQPGDYLVAYPYHPSVNLLSNRPTYERNVYVDNAIAEPSWNAHAIARLRAKRPAIVVISDWDINGTEASRFSVWAAPTKAWVQEHYTSQGTYLELEVFTRKE